MSRKSINMRQLSRQGGYTLLEAVVYIVILAIVVTTVMIISVRMVSALSDVRASQNITFSAQASLDRLARSIREAESVDSLQSVFNDSSGRLVLNLETNGEDVVYDYRLVDGGLRLVVDGGPGQDLLSNHVTASNFTVRHVTGSSTEAIQIELTLVDDRVSGRPVNFYTSATLR